MHRDARRSKWILSADANHCRGSHYLGIQFRGVSQDDWRRSQRCTKRFPKEAMRWGLERLALCSTRGDERRAEGWFPYLWVDY